MYHPASLILRNTICRRQLVTTASHLKALYCAVPITTALPTRNVGTTFRTMSSDSKPGSSASTASPSATSTLERPTPVKVKFPLSPVPPNPLGQGKCIRKAAALIIGDEILNGKTLDRNSHVFAQFCFEHGIDLKRIEVVPDIEEQIVEASRRLVKDYDFVITSGGIGPTHDDITYQSLATAFNQKLVHHEETIRRMTEMSKHRNWIGTQDEKQKAATLRMALFPDNAEVLFVGEDIWVPVVRLEGKLCVFPGIPGLFLKMLHGLKPFLPLPPIHERPLRIQVFTERPESMIAPYLTLLQQRLKPHGIQVGSYPVLYKGVFVSLIGRDLADSDSAGASTSSDGPGKTPKVWLKEVAREVEKEIGGRIVSDEDLKKRKEERDRDSEREEQAIWKRIEKPKL